jgi:hypothetical protein
MHCRLPGFAPREILPAICKIKSRITSQRKWGLIVNLRRTNSVPSMSGVIAVQGRNDQETWIGGAPAQTRSRRHWI